MNRSLDPHHTERDTTTAPDSSPYADVDPTGGSSSPPVGTAPAIQVRRAITARGIRIEGLLWNSKAVVALHRRLRKGEPVEVRMDPHDLRKAYLFDEKRGLWIEGELQGVEAAKRLTLSQHRHRQAHAQMSLKRARGEPAALRAYSEVFAFLEARTAGIIKGTADKRLKRFTRPTSLGDAPRRPSSIDPPTRAGAPTAPASPKCLRRSTHVSSKGSL